MVLLLLVLRRLEVLVVMEELVVLVGGIFERVKSPKKNLTNLYYQKRNLLAKEGIKNP